MRERPDFLTPDLLGGSYLYADSSSSDAVFGFVVSLTATVDGQILEDAVNALMTRFPQFAVKVEKDGEEYSFAEETAPVHVCRQGDGRETSSGHLFEVSYAHKTLFFCFHRALTDERGAVTFIRSVLFRYLTDSGYEVENDGSILAGDSVFSPHEAEDAFVKMDDIPASRPVWYMDAKAFSFSGTCSGPCTTAVIRIPLSKLKGQAKSWLDLTTAFVAPLFSDSVQKEFAGIMADDEYIVASIRVNLRQYFPTPSLRPFFTEIPLVYNRDIGEYPANTVIMSQKKLIEAQLKADALAYNAQRKISCLEKVMDAPCLSGKIGAERDVMRERSSTAAYSLCNVGNIILPESLSRYIVEFYPVLPSFLYPFSVTTSRLHGELVITVTSSIGADALCRRFVGLLDEYEMGAYVSDRLSFPFLKYVP